MTRTTRARVASITASLSFRLFVVLFLAILLLFSISAAVYGRFQRHIIENLVKADAYRASDFIRRSLLTRMLRNEREDIYAIIRLLGDEPGIEVVRIYNKEGEIKFSSAEAEIGSSVDLEAEACYACHASAQPLGAVPSEERGRIYVKGGDHRVLAVINPIPNDQACWNAACHAHGPDQSVLGVLDVQMSMESADGALAAARSRALTLGVAIIVLSLLVTGAIVYRGVHVPTKKLRQGTEALAAGDLEVEIDLPRADELGALARSFNRMARSLKAADADLRAWSRTLEERVHAKTAELEQVMQHMVQVERTASLGRLAATVAHELNNPLSGVVTYAKLAAKRVSAVVPPGNEQRRLLEHLELIRLESLRCGNIVRDLLTYARGGSATFAPVALHEVIERALRLVGHHGELGRVETHTEFALDDDLVVCDGDQVEQALIALLINAIEAMPEGGHLTVRTSPSPRDPGHAVTVSVQDTGVGIPPDARERLFDPFFSTKDATKGVGLGLAVVYGIVQRHEGDIRFESVVGSGTTFTIELPRNPAEAARERTLSDSVTKSVP